MDEKSVLKITKIENSILHISLNRPDSLNALSAKLMETLEKTFQMAKKEKKIKAILLSGEGKAFCAGADIHQLAKLNAQSGLAFARHGQEVFRMLETLGKPSLAAIHGFALGGGCELAMSTSMRIASQDAAFGQPEVKLGVIPGFGGTQRLSRLVGKGRALDLCLTGRIIKADEALHWGLVSEIVAPEELLKRATQVLTNVIKLGPLALQSIMNVIDQGYDMPLTEALELESVHFGLCCATADKQEGVTAFLEKRLADFKGE